GEHAAGRPARMERARLRPRGAGGVLQRGRGKRLPSQPRGGCPPSAGPRPGDHLFGPGPIRPRRGRRACRLPFVLRDRKAAAPRTRVVPRHLLFFGGLPGVLQQLWDSLPKAEKKFYTSFLDSLGYDTADPTLVVNEFQAYLMQQPLKYAGPYFERFTQLWAEI